jgi:sarcosine oxidase subunit alpha
LKTRSMRIQNHPILGVSPEAFSIGIIIDGKPYLVQEGDTIASAMVSLGMRVHRHTAKGSPRGLFCNIGKCSDCIVQVNGVPNIRACITDVQEGMIISTHQTGEGESDYFR